MFDFEQNSLYSLDELRERLTQICRERKQSRADFLRAAMTIHEQVPMINTRPLVGACLAKHLAKVERDKKAGRRSPGKG